MNTSRQLRKNEEVYFKGYYQPADRVATDIAFALHGLSGWQGVLGNGIYAPSGLKRLGNAALRTRSKDAIVYEDDLGNGTSHYYPSWK